jgi:prepilin-type N-terminal cleavage/methylation domain-containing protein
MRTFDSLITKIISMLKKKNLKIHYKRGFTIMEFLVVIGILTVLAGVIVIAINPAEKIVDARNSQRKAHVEAIYGAIEHCFFQGDLSCFDGKIAEETFDVIGCQADLIPSYLNEMPKDPVCGNGTTGYLAKKDGVGRMGVMANCAENEAQITAGTW